MNQIEKSISNLSSPDRDTRYKACVELRLADSIPEPAIAALEAATQDPDPLVAEAARRALAYHKAPSTPADQTNVQERQKTNGWAIASFTLGVLGCINLLLNLIIGLDSLCVCAIPTIFIVTIIVGVIAILKIKKNKPQQKGAGLAIAGIIIGVLTIIVFGGLFAYGFYVGYLK